VLGVHGRQVLQQGVPEGALEGAQGGVQEGAAGWAGFCGACYCLIIAPLCGGMGACCFYTAHFSGPIIKPLANFHQINAQLSMAVAGL
jgi:hypothetical protein